MDNLAKHMATYALTRSSEQTFRGSCGESTCSLKKPLSSQFKELYGMIECGDARNAIIKGKEIESFINNI